MRAFTLKSRKNVHSPFFKNADQGDTSRKIRHQRIFISSWYESIHKSPWWFHQNTPISEKIHPAKEQDSKLATTLAFLCTTEEKNIIPQWSQKCLGVNLINERLKWFFKKHWKKKLEISEDGKTSYAHKWAEQMLWNGKDYINNNKILLEGSKSKNPSYTTKI